jgi:hypothetical protein
VNDIPDHLDETGAPCTRHPPIAPANLYQLAMVGSRAPAFHHDCASKLQGLVMALDELTELAEHGDPQMLRAIETAMEASRELNALLNLNRALTRPAVKARVTLRELVTRGAERVGVSVNGALPDSLMVSVGVAPVTHAFALSVDVAAGSGRGRALTVDTTARDGVVEIALVTSTVQPTNAADALAIASFVVAREGGRLWCSAAGDRIVIRLPAG